MKKGILTALILAVVIIGLAFGGSKFFLSMQKKGVGGLKITSTPQSSVFLDGELKGKTPFEQNISAGTYVLKLTPEGTDLANSSWEREITVSPGLLTFINRELGASDLQRAGEILTLEKIDREEPKISVVSTPDGATIAFDGEEKEATPLVIDKGVSAGDHTLYVFAPGFNARQVRVKTTTGYKLNADIQLSLIAEKEEKSTDSGKKEEEKEDSGIKIKILDTPTGWLRVREEPSTSGSESARINPGEEFPFIEEKDDWFKIEYEEGKEGWISSTYAEKVEE